MSNSGRLKSIIEDVARDRRWHWAVHIVPDPDVILAEAADVVATADSVVLDRCGKWFALAREVIASQVPEARVVDLRDQECSTEPGA